jgi:O-antigen/teichoic acid export membrane protein
MTDVSAGGISGLRHKAAKAALTSGVASGATKFFTILLSVATARFLSPHEVGLLGLAVIVSGIVSMIGYYPEGAAVVASGDHAHNRYAIAATAIRAAFTAASLALVFIFFPTIADYLTGKDNWGNELWDLLAVLLWIPIMEILSGHQLVLLKRQLDLNYLALVQIVQSTTFVGLAVALLLLGRGYIGVAQANLISQIAVVILLWCRSLQKRWFKWEGWPSPQEWKRTLFGSMRIFVGGFGGFLCSRLDNVLVSGTIGPANMSFYSMAYNISHMPGQILSSAVNSALMPIFARIQGDPARIRRGFHECLRYYYIMLIPFHAAIFVAAPDLVSAVLGQKWLPLVPALRVMCFGILVGPLIDLTGVLLFSTGRAHLIGIATTLQLLALMLAMPPLARSKGVIGAAYCHLAVVVILAITLCGLARILTRPDLWDIAKSLSVPIVAAATGGLLGWQASAHLMSGPAWLLGKISIVFITYLSLLAAFGGSKSLADAVALLWKRTYSKVAHY